MTQEKKDFVIFICILAFLSFACALVADLQFRWCFGALGAIYTLCAMVVFIANRRKIT